MPEESTWRAHRVPSWKGRIGAEEVTTWTWGCCTEEDEDVAKFEIPNLSLMAPPERHLSVYHSPFHSRMKTHAHAPCSPSDPQTSVTAHSLAPTPHA